MERLYSKLGEEKNLREIAESFHTLFTTLDEGEKYLELFEKTLEAKCMMQLSSSDNCVGFGKLKIFKVQTTLVFFKRIVKHSTRFFSVSIEQKNYYPHFTMLFIHSNKHVISF